MHGAMPLLPPDTGLYYETYGERQVAAGHYRTVIRYDEHVRPLIHALQQ